MCDYQNYYYGYYTASLYMKNEEDTCSENKKKIKKLRKRN